MTPSKPFQTNSDKDKEPTKGAREVESEIGETRNAISGDIKALNEKFTRANSKEQAKDTLGGVKDAAVEQAVGTKDAVVDKALEVKDVVVEKAIEVKDAAAEKIVEAKDAVADAVHDVGEQAARAGSATWQFTRANAVPLALVGVGAGWLIANTRSRSVRRLEPAYRSGAWAEDTERYPSTPTPPRARAASEPRRQAMMSGHVPGDGAKSSSAGRAERKIAEGAARSAKYVQEKLQAARTATGDFAGENPLLVAMATLAAGIGVGMLLPSTEGENKLLAPSRAKLARLLGDVREAATDVAQVAKDTASDSLQAMR